MLNNLALLLQATNRLSEAEPLYRRALAIDEKSYGPDHPDVAIRLNNLAELLRATNRLSEAEPLIAALAIASVVRPDHPTSRSPQQPGDCSRHESSGGGRAAHRRAGHREKSYGPDHPDVAIRLNNLASCSGPRIVCRRPSRSIAARWPSTRNRTAPTTPPSRSASTTWRCCSRPRIACRRPSRSIAAPWPSARNRTAPTTPPSRSDLNNLASLLQDTNRLSEAEPLYRRAWPSTRNRTAPTTPPSRSDLNNLALLLQATNRLSEAEPLYRRAWPSTRNRTAPTTPTSRPISTTWRCCSRPRIACAEAEPLMARAVCVFSRFQRSTGHEHPNMRAALENFRRLLTDLKLAEPEIAARIKAAREGTDKLSPIIPEVERLLGPAKPVADVLASLDRHYREQGKPAVYFLKPDEPIAPHLDELLRPSGDGLNSQGVLAFRASAYAEAIVFYDAALDLMAKQTAQVPAKLRARMNRAAALRELGLLTQARDELVKLLPEIDQVSGVDATTKGRARYHLATCQWRLGDRAAAQRSAEESLAAFDAAPKANPVDPGLRRQSEELLAAVKAGKAPPPLAKIDAPCRARNRPRPLSSPRGADQTPAKPEGGSLARQGPRPSAVHPGGLRRARPLLPRAREARGLVPAAQGTDCSAPRSTAGAGQDRRVGAGSVLEQMKAPSLTRSGTLVRGKLSEAPRAEDFLSCGESSEMSENNRSRVDRREFLQAGAAVTAASALTPGTGVASAQDNDKVKSRVVLPTRKLGTKTAPKSRSSPSGPGAGGRSEAPPTVSCGSPTPKASAISTRPRSTGPSPPSPSSSRPSPRRRRTLSSSPRIRPGHPSSSSSSLISGSRVWNSTRSTLFSSTGWATITPPTSASSS